MASSTYAKIVEAAFLVPFLQVCFGTLRLFSGPVGSEDPQVASSCSANRTEAESCDIGVPTDPFTPRKQHFGGLAV